MSLQNQKQLLREKIWREMEEKHIAVFPLPCYSRIPNFVGSDAAGDRLRSLEEWKKARTIFANPDAAQRKARENALRDGKVLVMVSPKLVRDFLLINPEAVRGREPFVATIKGAFKLEKSVKGFSKPDLIVTGSVAVDLTGNRLGKGRGYGDREIRTVKERFGEIPVVTTVHDIQVVDFVPSTMQDEEVDIVVTPTKVIRVEPK